MSKSLEIGIVGLPNVGKSTLFNCLTKNNVLVANYPFATIDPNVGIVGVPDPRLEKLAELYNSKKIVPATVSFVDIAGLVKDAHLGEGLGNQFLSHIRECQIIIHLVRVFQDINVQHVGKTSNPKLDIETINTELILADLQTVSKRLPRLEKEAKSNPKLMPEVLQMRQAYEMLDKGQLLSTDPTIPKDLGNLQLITAKKMIYVFNIADSDLTDSELRNRLVQLVYPSPSLFVSAKLEFELNSLDPEEAQELLASYGQNSSSLDQLVNVAYKALGLQSFLTAGEKEVRAWTIEQGMTAPKAAGAIHTDFERGFIAAEVVSYQDLITFGSLIAARAAGKIRTEGRSYVMLPDDIVEFRFNV
jgi:GTP-binding protein YchF